MSNEPLALVPADDGGDAEDAGRDSPVPALMDLYHELPGDVVAIVEYERQAITRDFLDHLRHIRDALAPYGKFRDWCRAVGFNYGTVSNRLSRADKPAVNQPLTDLLLLAPVDQPQPVAQDSLVGELLAWGIFLRPIRDQLKRDVYEALCWVLAWASLRHEGWEADDALVAQLAAVLSWSVGEADAARIGDYAALEWALTRELETVIIRRMDRVPPMLY